MADSLLQRSHLYRRQRRLKPLVSHLQPSAINSLLQVLARKHPKSMWNTSLLRRLPNPPRDFVNDHVIMRRIPAQQTTKTNNRVILPCLRDCPRRQRNLTRPWYPHQINIFPDSARAHQPIDGAKQKPLSNKSIEPRNHDSKALAQSAKRALERGKTRPRKRLHHEILLVFRLRDSAPPWWTYPVPLCDPCGEDFDFYFPLNTAARFSKKAAVPSFLSSVAQATPNKTASRYNPSLKVISTPLLTASIAYCTASGAFAIIFAAIASARGINSAATVISFTNPMRCASCAVIISPASTICIAMPLPTSRGSRCDPPYPGIIPSFTSGCPSLAFSLASRIVQAKAISHPPPKANPLMHAITGFPRFSIRLRTFCPRCVYSFPVTASCLANSPMSAPAINAFSPAPVRMTTRMEASFLMS